MYDVVLGGDCIYSPNVFTPEDVGDRVISQVRVSWWR